MTKPLRIGVIGGGLIAQAEHIPNLIGLPELFELAGVCDPSPSSREFISRRFRAPVFSDSDALLGEGLDAVLIASPDFTHVEETLKALSRGLHVFCEKPLCYGPHEADEVIAARDAAGKVVQVGYMKRHDPSFEAALELLPESADKLRYLSVEVNDPDAWPFLEPHPHQDGGDLPASLIEAGRAKQIAQIERALGGPVDPLILKGFASAFASSLVHDVNAAHGLLDKMGVPEGEITGAEIFAGGAGGLGTVRLLDGQAILQMVHLKVPGLADYRERIALYFDDRIIELIFPSPMLNHHPTRLLVRESDGLTLETREIRPGYGEAFVRQLEAFWKSVAQDGPMTNTVEQARRDLSLLCGLARRCMARAG